LSTRILILTIIEEWNPHQIPLVHERKKKPLIGRRDFHKLSLAKGKHAQGRVLWVAPSIYDLLFVLKERDL
jgi:hypothetical protein